MGSWISSLSLCLSEIELAMSTRKCSWVCFFRGFSGGVDISRSDMRSLLQFNKVRALVVN